MEKQIREEREALDQAVPRSGLWDNISSQLESRQMTSPLAGADPAQTVAPHSNTSPRDLPLATGSTPYSQAKTPVTRRIRALLPVLRVAAVLTLITAAGLWLTQSDRQGGGVLQPTGTTATVETSQESDLDESTFADPRFAELRNMESEYARLSKKKSEIILSNPGLSPEDAQQAVDLIEDLENDYRQLRLELDAGADAEKVVEAMVRNYRQRIEVLERMSELLTPKPTPQKQEEYATSIVL